MRSSKKNDKISRFSTSAPPLLTLTPRSIRPTPPSSLARRTVSTPADSIWGNFAAIAATSASAIPSDFKNATASPGAEAAATLPRALLGFLLFAVAAFALALVERRDLPIDEEAKEEGPWLLFSAARVIDRTTDVCGVVVIGERAKAPPTPLAEFGTPAAVEKRAIDARIVAGDEKQRY